MSRVYNIGFIIKLLMVVFFLLFLIKYVYVGFCIQLSGCRLVFAEKFPIDVLCLIVLYFTIVFEY